MNRRDFIAGLIPAIPLLGIGIFAEAKKPEIPSKIELSTGDGGTGKVELFRDHTGHLYMNLSIDDRNTKAGIYLHRCG